GTDKASFDPRPDPKKPKERKEPPPFAVGDLVGSSRVELADLGIGYLDKAVSLRPNYFEAMIYLNLLYRQRSFAFFDRPAQWQECVDRAADWQRRALPLQHEGSVPSGAVPSSATAHE